MAMKCKCLGTGPPLDRDRTVPVGYIGFNVRLEEKLLLIRTTYINVPFILLKINKCRMLPLCTVRI